MYTRLNIVLDVYDTLPEYIILPPHINLLMHFLFGMKGVPVPHKCPSFK